MSDAATPHQRRRLRSAALAAVVVLALVAGLAWFRLDRRTGTRFDALFSATVGVYPGSDVRMLGVRVGAVDSVTPVGTGVRVRMHLDRGRSAAADTGAVILSPSLVSDRYVQLTGLHTSGPKLAAGSTIPASRTATPVELDQLYSSVDELASALGPSGANATGSLSKLIGTGAADLAGNGKALRETISQLSKASSVFADSRDDLFQTIDNLQSFTSTLAGSDAGVRQVNQQLASVSRFLAADRQDFADALNQLGTALDALTRFLRDNRARIRSNVDKLAATTAVLVKQKQSLQQVLASAPLALQNLLNAYDPAHNTLNGRADLNELDGWGAGASAPPLLLPSDGIPGVSSSGASTSPTPTPRTTP